MNLPTENNNPGDLRDVGQSGATQGAGGFAAFASPQAGGAALLNQIQTNIDKSPNETLEGFATHYAPPSDGNNTAQYTADLANQLGVSPGTTIGSLEPQIGQFAEAIAKNEGYDAGQSGVGGIVGPGTGKAISQTAGDVSNAVGGPAAATAGLIGGASALGAGALALGGEGLADISGIGGDIVGGIKGLFGGNNSQNSTSQTTTPTQNPILSGTPDYPQSQTSTNPTSPTQIAPMNQASGDTSKVANAFDNVLSTTVGGVAAQQEANARGGIGSLGTAAAGMGLIPEVDENGNYDKVSPTLLANAGNAKDAEYQDKMLDQMTSPTEISDARSAAEKYIREKTANTGDTENAVAHSNKYFDDIEANRPMIKDKNGKTIKSRFLKPKELQEMQKKLSVNEKDFARPQWERSSATHIKASLVKRLDEIAKQENIKGWSETKKRMEIRFAIKKAIKALPKKAPRDFKKEMLKEIVGVASGALIAKTLGQNSLVGGLVGGLVQNQLHKKSYKQLSSKKERGLLERRAKAHPQNLLNGKPNKTPNKV